MGTPEFSCPGLESLLADPVFEIIGVFTQTDKPVGRRQIMTAPPVKRLALGRNLPVFQPLRIRREAETIRGMRPDMIVVIAYGQIIPQAILDIPVFGCINVHASLLPKYRGAACLSAPILNGDTETGVTIMKMEAGLDTGPILRQTKLRLNRNETLLQLHDRLAEIGAAQLPQTLKDYAAGLIEPQPQGEFGASYVRTLKKEDGHIDWHKPAVETERMIRAYNPWPGTYAILDKTTSSRTVKILAVEHKPIPLNGRKPGELFLDDKRIAVQCGQDSLVILRLQIAGGKALSAADFLTGNSSLIGTVLD